MKINFMMTTIGIAFLTVVGILLAEYYTINQAIAQGLQQCVMTVNDTVEVVWTKECQNGVEGK